LNNEEGPQVPHDVRQPFSARLLNEISVVEVIQTEKKIIITDPDDWEPFSWHEELTCIDNTTLQFTTSGSIRRVFTIYI
jgi:hypothetical protein